MVTGSVGNVSTSLDPRLYDTPSTLDSNLSQGFHDFTSVVRKFPDT